MGGTTDPSIVTRCIVEETKPTCHCDAPSVSRQGGRRLCPGQSLAIRGQRSGAAGHTPVLLTRTAGGGKYVHPWAAARKDPWNGGTHATQRATVAAIVERAWWRHVDNLRWSSYT